MDNKPQQIPKDLATIESQSLETHVVVSHERHEEIQKRFDKIETMLWAVYPFILATVITAKFIG